MNLEQHLKQENPSLVPFVKVFRKLDTLLHSLQLIDDEDSSTKLIGFWPAVSVVGQFSSGKSSLINSLIGQDIQKTGGQAVDDKFTVIAYGKQYKELPGVALESDPRFPFHGTASQIEMVSPGDGRKIDNFLSLKIVNSDFLKGMMIVDSPGFDSDSTRASILKLVDQILDISDLTIVLFDARKPEPGVMRDTLNILVSKIKERGDINKFLFVLNQIDASSQENFEEILNAWHKALATVGFSTGRFYTIYNDKLANNVTPRKKEMRDRDMAEIMSRIAEIPRLRGYRIANEAKIILGTITDEIIPMLTSKVSAAKKRANLFTSLTGLGIFLASMGLGTFFGSPFILLQFLASHPLETLLVTLSVMGFVHYKTVNYVFDKAVNNVNHPRFNVKKAFMSGRIPFLYYPISWYVNRKRLTEVRNAVNDIVTVSNTTMIG